MFNFIEETTNNSGSNQTQTDHQDIAVPQQWVSSLREEISQQHILELNLADIEPDPDQPRRQLDEDALLDLAQSIEEHNLLQPIVVQPQNSAGKYRIIMGERRWRAHEFTGRTTIAAIVRPAADGTVLALQIIENNQREDISPLEEAYALERLVAVSGSKKEVAQAIGRSASWLSKRLALLTTPEPIQQFAQQQAINDVNTLNSLSKLYQEAPERAETLMLELKNQGIEGSLRAHIEQARKREQPLETASPATTQKAPEPQQQAPDPSANPVQQHIKQLNSRPLASLDGIETLTLHLNEIELRFSEFAQQSEPGQTFQQVWQAFVRQKSA